MKPTPFAEVLSYAAAAAAELAAHAWQTAVRNTLSHVVLL